MNRIDRLNNDFNQHLVEKRPEQLYRGLSAERLVYGGADCFLRAIYKLAHADIHVSRDPQNSFYIEKVPDDYIPYVTKIWKKMGRKKSLLNPHTKTAFIDTTAYFGGYRECWFNRGNIKFNWKYITNYVDKIAHNNGWTKISQDFMLPFSWLFDRKKVAIIYLGPGAQGAHTHYYIEADFRSLVWEFQNNGPTTAYYKILD